MINGSTGYNVSNYYPLPDFTGSKPVNKVTIRLQKRGESVIVLSNNSKILECKTAFAPATTLKGLIFYVNEKNQFFVSNIQIRRL